MRISVTGKPRTKKFLTQIIYTEVLSLNTEKYLEFARLGNSDLVNLPLREKN